MQKIIEGIKLLFFMFINTVLRHPSAFLRPTGIRILECRHFYLISILPTLNLFEAHQDE